METIKLNDILHLTEEQLEKTKFRFMVENKEYNFSPTKNADDPAIQERLNLRDLVNNSKTISFKKDVIAIGFVPLGNDMWLMTGIVEVIKDNGKNKPATARYLLKKYNFRLIVQFHKYHQGGGHSYG